MCFVKGFILVCVLHITFSQSPFQRPEPPIIQEQPPPPPPPGGARGLVIPRHFQDFGTSNTATSVWQRRHGTTQTNAVQTNPGLVPSTSEKSNTQANRAGGMVVHPFQNVANFGVDGSVSSSNVQGTQQGRGTPIQFPSDSPIGQLPKENIIQPIKSSNTNPGTSSDRLTNEGSTTGIQIPISTVNANANRLLNKNTGSTAEGVQVPVTFFNVNTKTRQDKNPLNTGSTSVQGVQIPMTTFNANVNTVQDKSSLNTGSKSTGVQDPMATFNANTLLDKSSGSAGVQIPFNTFNINANRHPLNTNSVNSASTGTRVETSINPFNTNDNRRLNENTLNTGSVSSGIQVPTNTFNSNANRLQNKNILEPRPSNTISSQLPNTNNIRSPVGVQHARNVVTQNQEFIQVGKTAVEANPPGSFNFNPPRTSPQGVGGSNNINNLQTSCDFQPVYIDSPSGKVFDPRHFVHGGEQFDCPPGTMFNPQKCHCVFANKDVLAEFYAKLPPGTGCKESFYIDFNTGIHNVAANKGYVAVEGIQNFNGVGHFSGRPNTSLSIPRYNHHGIKKIAFEFKFRSNITNRNHPHPLLTNCVGYPNLNKQTVKEPTFGVILNSNSTFITYFVTFLKQRAAPNAMGDPAIATQFITFNVINPLVWNTVRFSYDFEYLRAELNGERKRLLAPGIIADNLEKIFIGHCLRYGEFIGQMDDIKIYTDCMPKRYLWTV